MGPIEPKIIDGKRSIPKYAKLIWKKRVILWPVLVNRGNINGEDYLFVEGSKSFWNCQIEGAKCSHNR